MFDISSIDKSEIDGIRDVGRGHDKDIWVLWNVNVKGGAGDTCGEEKMG